MNIIRLISTLLILTYCLELPLQAAPVSSVHHLLSGHSKSENISLKHFKGLNSDVYTLEDVQLYSGAPRILFIQDPHVNVSGQKNIAHILDWAAQSGYTTAYLEAGSENVSLRDIAQDKSLTQVNSVAEKNIKRGEITGAEYHSLINEKPLDLWGVEDQNLYWDSIDLYKSIVANRKSTQNELSVLRQTLLAQSDRYINPTLLTIRTLNEKFQNEDLPFESYAIAILRISHDSRMDMQIYGDLAYLTLQIQRQSAIDFKKANEEYQNLLNNYYQKHCVEDAAEPDCLDFNASGSLLSNIENLKLFSDQQNDSESKKLLENKIKSNSDLDQYVEYLQSLKDVDILAAMEQIEQLQKDLEERFAFSELEKSWLSTIRLLESISQMVDLKANYETTQPFIGSANISVGEWICASVNRTSILSQIPGACTISSDSQTTIEQSIQFYKKTLLRDRAFISNMLRNMEKNNEDKAVLIAGGYHASNIKKLLRSRQIGFYSIQPVVEQETDHARYERLLTNQISTENGITGVNEAGIGIWAAKNRQNAPIMSELVSLTSASRLSDDTTKDSQTGPQSGELKILPATVFFAFLGIIFSTVSVVLTQNPSILWAIPGWVAGGLLFDLLGFIISKFDKTQAKANPSTNLNSDAPSTEGASGDVQSVAPEVNIDILSTEKSADESNAIPSSSSNDNASDQNTVSISSEPSKDTSATIDKEEVAGEGLTKASSEDAVAQENVPTKEESAPLETAAPELSEVEKWWISEAQPVLSLLIEDIEKKETPLTLAQAVGTDSLLHEAMLKIVPDFTGFKIQFSEPDAPMSQEALKDLVWFIRNLLIQKQSSIIPVVRKQDQTLVTDKLLIEKIIDDIGVDDLDRKIYVVREDQATVESVVDANDIRIHSQENKNSPLFTVPEEKVNLRKKSIPTRGFGVVIAAIAVIHGVLLAPVSVWLTIGIAVAALTTVLVSKFKWMDRGSRREFKVGSAAFVAVLTSFLLYAGLSVMLPTLGTDIGPIEIQLEMIDTTVSESEVGDTEQEASFTLSGAQSSPQEPQPQTTDPVEPQKNQPSAESLQQAIADLQSQSTPVNDSIPTSDSKPFSEDVFTPPSFQVTESDFLELSEKGIGKSYAGISTGDGKKGKKGKVFDVYGQELAVIHDISVVFVTDTSASISNKNLERNYFNAIQVATYLMHQEAGKDKTVEYASYGTDSETFKLLDFNESGNLAAVNRSLAQLQAKWGQGASDFKQTLDAMARMFDGSKGKRRLIIFFTDASGLNRDDAMRYKQYYKRYGIDIAIVGLESNDISGIPNSINLSESIDAHSILQVILSIVSEKSKTGEIPVKLKDIVNISPSLIEGARLSEDRRIFTSEELQQSQPKVVIEGIEESSVLFQQKERMRRAQRYSNIRSVIWSVLLFTPLLLLIPYFSGTLQLDSFQNNNQPKVNIPLIDPQKNAEDKLVSLLEAASKTLQDHSKPSQSQRQQISRQLKQAGEIIFESFPDLSRQYRAEYDRVSTDFVEVNLSMVLQDTKYESWTQAVQLWRGEGDQLYKISENELNRIQQKVLSEAIAVETRKVHAEISELESKISGDLVQIESLSGLLSDRAHLIETSVKSRVSGTPANTDSLNDAVLSVMEMPMAADPLTRLQLLYPRYGYRYSELSDRHFYMTNKERGLDSVERVYIKHSHLEIYLSRLQKREVGDFTEAVLQDQPELLSEYDRRFRDGNEELYRTLKGDRFGYVYSLGRDEDTQFRTISSLGGTGYINGNIISAYELINLPSETLKEIGVSRVAIDSRNRVTLYFADRDLYSQDFQLYEPVTIVTNKDANGKVVSSKPHRVYMTPDTYRSVYAPRTSEVLKEDHQNRIARSITLLKQSIAAGDTAAQIESLGGEYRVQHRLRWLQNDRGTLQEKLNQARDRDGSLRSFVAEQNPELEAVYASAIPNVVPGTLSENQRVMWGRLFESLGREEDASLLDQPIDQINGLLTVRFADYLTRQIRRNFRSDQSHLDLALTLAAGLPAEADAPSVSDIVEQIRSSWITDTNAVSAAISDLNEHYLSPRGYFVRGYIADEGTRNLSPELVSVLGIRGLQQVHVGGTDYYITHTDSGNLESMQGLLGYSQTGVSVANVNRDKTIATFQRIKEILGESPASSVYGKLLQQSVRRDFGGLNDRQIYEKVYRMILSNESQHAFEHSLQVDSERSEERSDYGSIAEGSAPYFALMHFASHVRSGVYDEENQEYALEAARSLDRLYQMYTGQQSPTQGQVGLIENALKNAGISEVDAAIETVISTFLKEQSGDRERLAQAALSLLKTDPAFKGRDVVSPHQSTQEVSFPLERSASVIFIQLWNQKKSDIESVADILTLLKEDDYWREGSKKYGWNASLADESIAKILKPAIQRVLSEASQSKQPMSLEEIMNRIEVELQRVRAHTQNDSSAPDVNANPIGTESGSRLAVDTLLPNRIQFIGNPTGYQFALELELDLSVQDQVIPWLISGEFLVGYQNISVTTRSTGGVIRGFRALGAKSNGNDVLHLENSVGIPITTIPDTKTAHAELTRLQANAESIYRSQKNSFSTASIAAQRDIGRLEWRGIDVPVILRMDGDDWLAGQDVVTSERAIYYLLKAFESSAQLLGESYAKGLIHLEIFSTQKSTLIKRIVQESGIQGVTTTERVDQTDSSEAILFHLINKERANTITSEVGSLFLSYDPRASQGQIHLFDAPAVFAWALSLAQDAAGLTRSDDADAWTKGEWISDQSTHFADHHILSTPTGGSLKLAQLVTGADIRLLTSNLLKIVRLNLREMVQTTMMRLHLTSISA